MRNTTFLQHIVIQRLTLALLLSAILLIYINAKAETNVQSGQSEICSVWSSATVNHCHSQSEQR